MCNVLLMVPKLDDRGFQEEWEDGALRFRRQSLSEAGMPRLCYWSFRCYQVCVVIGDRVELAFSLMLSLHKKNRCYATADALASDTLNEMHDNTKKRLRIKTDAGFE